MTSDSPDDEEDLSDHPLVQMLLGERRDVVDFWLAHEDYHGLLEDHDAGLLDEEAFHAKVTAWTRRFEADGRREGFIADPEEKPRAATPLQLQAPLLVNWSPVVSLAMGTELSSRTFAGTKQCWPLFNGPQAFTAQVL